MKELEKLLNSSFVIDPNIISINEVREYKEEELVEIERKKQVKGSKRTK